jgi:hypothetical protein
MGLKPRSSRTAGVLVETDCLGKYRKFGEKESQAAERNIHPNILSNGRQKNSSWVLKSH